MTTFSPYFTQMATHSMLMHRKNTATVSERLTARFYTILQGKATKQLRVFSAGIIPVVV